MVDSVRKGHLQFELEKLIIEEKQNQENEQFLGYRLMDAIQKLKGTNIYIFDKTNLKYRK